MRKFLFLLCLVLIVFPIFADDEPSYSLRQPSSEDFVSALVTVWGQSALAARYQVGGANRFDIETIAEKELLHRFPDLFSEDSYLSFEVYSAYYDADFSSVLDAYLRWNDPFDSSSYFVYYGAQHRNRKRWNEELMVMWLNQNQIDLDAYAELQYTNVETGEVLSNFDEHRFTVLPVDFDNDGQNEWILENGFGFYLAIARSNGEYHALNHHLWWNYDYDSFINIAVYYYSLAIEDITGDGIKEWIVLQNSAIRDRGHESELIIMSWRDNSLDWACCSSRLSEYVQETELEDWHETNAWSFQNLDEDAALEIRVAERTYDWNGRFYVDPSLASASTITPVPYPTLDVSPTPSASSYFRWGQYAFWEGDYLTALDYFAGVTAGQDALCYSPNNGAGNELLQLYDDLCLHYMRGLSLEALGRYEEALSEFTYVLNGSLSVVDFGAEYVSIEAIVPVFTWYSLASLHLNIHPPIELPDIGQG